MWVFVIPGINVRKVSKKPAFSGLFVWAWVVVYSSDCGLKIRFISPYLLDAGIDCQ